MNKEQGYTLLELIITIGLISIAIGLSSFGLNVIYTSNVGSYASQVTNDIKLVQTKEMASNGKDYRLILDHDGSKYTVLIQVSTDGSNWNMYKNYKLPKAMVIKKGTFWFVFRD